MAHGLRRDPPEQAVGSLVTARTDFNAMPRLAGREYELRVRAVCAPAYGVRCAYASSQFKASDFSPSTEAPKPEAREGVIGCDGVSPCTALVGQGVPVEVSSMEVNARVGELADPPAPEASPTPVPVGHAGSNPAPSAPATAAAASEASSLEAQVRAGGAEAVTIPETIRGFQGYRYRWWRRYSEVPFPDWMVTA